MDSAVPDRHNLSAFIAYFRSPSLGGIFGQVNRSLSREGCRTEYRHENGLSHSLIVNFKPKNSELDLCARSIPENPGDASGLRGGRTCFLFRLKVFVVDYPVVLDVGGPCSYDICSEAVFCAIDHFDQPVPSAILRTLAPFAASTGGRLSPNFLSVTMWLP
jgi:hypothetical protein